MTGSAALWSLATIVFDVSLYESCFRRDLAIHGEWPIVSRTRHDAGTRSGRGGRITDHSTEPKQDALGVANNALL